MEFIDTEPFLQFIDKATKEYFNSFSRYNIHNGYVQLRCAITVDCYICTYRDDVGDRTKDEYIVQTHKVFANIPVKLSDLIEISVKIHSYEHKIIRDIVDISCQMFHPYLKIKLKNLKDEWKEYDPYDYIWFETSYKQYIDTEMANKIKMREVERHEYVGESMYSNSRNPCEGMKNAVKRRQYKYVGYNSEIITGIDSHNHGNMQKIIYDSRTFFLVKDIDVSYDYSPNELDLNICIFQTINTIDKLAQKTVFTFNKINEKYGKILTLVPISMMTEMVLLFEGCNSEDDKESILNIIINDLLKNGEKQSELIPVVRVKLLHIVHAKILDLEIKACINSINYIADETLEINLLLLVLREIIFENTLLILRKKYLMYFNGDYYEQFKHLFSFL